MPSGRGEPCAALSEVCSKVAKSEEKIVTLCQPEGKG